MKAVETISHKIPMIASASLKNTKMHKWKKARSKIFQLFGTFTLLLMKLCCFMIFHILVIICVGVSEERLKKGSIFYTAFTSVQK